MADPQRRSTRRQKIEPLNYAEAALSPALKGMTSFLDVSPENVRNGTFQEFGPAGIRQRAARAGSRQPQPLPDDGSSTEHQLNSSIEMLSTATPLRLVESIQHEITPGDETYSGVETGSPVDKGMSLRHHRLNKPIYSRPEIPSASQLVPQSSILASLHAVEEGSSSPEGLHPGDESIPGGSSINHLLALEISAWPRHNDAPSFEPAIEEAPPIVEMTPGDETKLKAIRLDIPLTPGRGRSKIKRCVLAQDGHSLGEEAIYQVLWRTGRVEGGDPNGSRTNRMGAAELGYKVNMAKKNVRQNISRLFEKLALEIIEDFGTMTSQARLYRVFSYKQILERRRAAGMEYVLRNKGVVFCSQDGKEIVSSPAYVSSPGAQTSLRPAPPKKRRASRSTNLTEFSEISSPTPYRASGTEGDGDLEIVSQALNRYWAVDEPAAIQLIRSCRRVRQDARAEEIAFFVREKTELARQNRSITNPTGLILATVPQSFVGATFDEFRSRMERQAILAAEEQERKAMEQVETVAWITAERDLYESIVSDFTKTQGERDAAEKKLRQLAEWNP